MLETIEYKKTLDSFHDYLFGVIKLHRDMIPKLKDELMLIKSNSIDELNDNLNHQQVFLYQTKTFNKEVAVYMKELNLTGANLSEVIQQLPISEQERFAKLIKEFDEIKKQVQFYKEKCQTLLEAKLHVVKKNIAQFELKRDKTTYQENGKEAVKTDPLRTFEKSI